MACMHVSLHDYQFINHYLSYYVMNYFFNRNKVGREFRNMMNILKYAHRFYFNVSYTYNSNQ